GAKINISNPLHPVHLTHINFNSSTQELSGLPSYYCQLLKESGYIPSRRPEMPPLSNATVRTSSAVSKARCLTLTYRSTTKQPNPRRQRHLYIRTAEIYPHAVSTTKYQPTPSLKQLNPRRQCHPYIRTAEIYSHAASTAKS
ncbi:hypothetical protein B0H14DRAFT_2420422, partial [Mycena olivaceomarginata]